MVDDAIRLPGPRASRPPLSLPSPDYQESEKWDARGLTAGLLETEN